MRNLILGLVTGIIISACASDIVMPAFNNQIFLIDQDRPVIYFPYCERYKFWSKDECKDKKRKIDVYDLNNKETRTRFKDFVVVHRKRVF